MNQVILKIKQKFNDKTPTYEELFNFICPISKEAYKNGECLSFDEYDIISKGSLLETVNYISKIIN